MRSSLSARGGSSRDSGNKEVEARARARIPGAGGAPAPRPRPATHGAESRQPLSLSHLGVAIWGLGGRVWEDRLALQALHQRLPRAPGVKPRGARGRLQIHGRRRGTGSAVAAAAAAPAHTKDRLGDKSRRPSRRTGSGLSRVTACNPLRRRSNPALAEGRAHRYCLEA